MPRISHAAALAAVVTACQLASSGANAIIPFAGWGYSVGNAIVGITPWSGEGAGWWDPPADTILNGKITLKFDPSNYQIVDYGWFGGFGADPTIAAPVITDDPNDAWFSTWTLQAPNAAMTATVDLSNTAGTMVVTFDWGAAGYTPSSTAHFNFFGFIYSVPDGMTNEQLQAATTGPFGPGKIVTVQSPLDAALGNNAPTYLACSGGYCGVPEPKTYVLMLVGFAALGAAASFAKLHANRRSAGIGRA